MALHPVPVPLPAPGSVRTLETPRLVSPTVRVHDSFLAALAEHHAEGVHLGISSSKLADFDTFLDHVLTLNICRDPDLNHSGRAGIVKTFWYVSGSEYLGRLTFRPHLSHPATDMFGHIGYEVRPSRRGEGHATRMLQEALPVAAEAGLPEVLLTCSEGNRPSRKVIEAAGGRLDSVRDGVLRHWVPTQQS